MTDLVVRLVLIAVVVAAATGVASWARRRERRRALRAPLDLTDLDGDILFFSDAVCSRCDVMRARLVALGVEFHEIAYDRDPETHRRVGVTGVPLVVVRDATGVEVRRFAGVPGRARLALALGGRR